MRACVKAGYMSNHATLHLPPSHQFPVTISSGVLVPCLEPLPKLSPQRHLLPRPYIILHLNPRDVYISAAPMI